jgi:hypothetical protein
MRIEPNGIILDAMEDDRIESPICDCVDMPMHLESNRLKTFHHWPLDFICKKELAKDGFFYMGKSDLVRCHFCKIGLQDWQMTDDVRAEHTKWSPECPFILGQRTNNIPLIETDYTYYIR